MMTILEKNNLTGRTLSILPSSTIAISRGEVKVNLIIENRSCGVGQGVALHVEGEFGYKA